MNEQIATGVGPASIAIAYERLGNPTDPEWLARAPRARRHEIPLLAAMVTFTR
jgi:hypothetical protein